MDIQEFNLDVENVIILKNEERIDSDGNTVVRMTLENGFVWVYTNTPNGFKRMDFSHELFKLPNNIYRIDINNPKHDFVDYY